MRYIYDRQERTETPTPRENFSPNYPSALRHELSQLNRKWALDHAFPHEVTRGSSPAVLYQQDEAGDHGNFLRASYRAIQQRPEWARRLAKAHTTTRRALLRDEQQSRRPRRSELDSSNSSDALLMNIFCHPKTLASPRVCALLGIDATAEPNFGFKPRIPFLNGRSDCSEIDLKLGDLLIEAKLTEYDFQTAPRRLIERYPHLAEVFDLYRVEKPERSANDRVFRASDPADPSDVNLIDPDLCEANSDGQPRLAVDQGGVHSYQLIRGVIAAYATPGTRFCVLCDARRPDLIARWHQVIMAVKIYDLRNRLLLLTWQELAPTLPTDLRRFLRDKFGIV